MTHWGISNFENESAVTFLSDLDTNGYGLLNLALDKVLDENIEPTVMECEESLLAAEIIAAVCGKASPELPEDAAEWIQNYLPEGSPQKEEIAALSERAADVIDKIVTDSELKALWEEHEGFDDWFELQVALQNRLLG